MITKEIDKSKKVESEKYVRVSSPLQAFPETCQKTLTLETWM